MGGESESGDEFECEYCDKTYSSKKGLNRHIDMKHLKGN